MVIKYKDVAMQCNSGVLEMQAICMYGLVDSKYEESRTYVFKLKKLFNAPTFPVAQVTSERYHSSFNFMAVHACALVPKAKRYGSL